MKTGTKIDFYPIGKPDKIASGTVMAAVGENQYKVALPNGKLKLIDTVSFVIKNYSTIKLVLEFIIKLIKQLKPGNREERKTLKNEIRKAKGKIKRDAKGKEKDDHKEKVKSKKAKKLDDYTYE